MKFNGIEDFDHFQDASIFWAALTDLPAELKSGAVLIDGNNYNETCFGVCAMYDAETQTFDLVMDMDGGEAHAVYYIDNDGDKHWFVCEIPEELTKRIFAECQQVLDFKKIEYGYTVKKCIQFEDGSGFVVAENPVSKRPLLTAHFTAADRGQRYYGERRFFHSWNDAVEDFTKRAEQRKQFLCVKPSLPQKQAHQRQGRKAGVKPKKQPKQKRR